MSVKRPFANTPAFYAALRWFYAVWSRTESQSTARSGKASGTETAGRAHERAARMKFSDKCKHLRTLFDSGKILEPRESARPADMDRKPIHAERLRAFIPGDR
jgi:hypothetical protein